MDSIVTLRQEGPRSNWTNSRLKSAHKCKCEYERCVCVYMYVWVSPGVEWLFIYEDLVPLESN